MKLADTFRSLKHANYRLWFIGQSISLIGTWMQTMAQQLLVYRLTNSAAALGIISFLSFIPLVLFSVWGGSISDRFPKRKVILTAQLLMLVQALLLSYLTWTQSIEVWHVYLLAFFLGFCQAIDNPARQAFTVEMVEGPEDLANAIGLNSAMFNGGRAIGPAAAGVVVAAVGEGPAFLLNGLSFFAVIISLLLMRNLPEKKQAAHFGGTLRHMAEGFQYVTGSKTVITLMSIVGVSAFLSMPYTALMPVFSGTVLKQNALPIITWMCGGKMEVTQCQNPDALVLGLLMTMVGIGAVIGSLTIASLNNYSRKGILLTFGNFSFPACLFLFALSKSFVVSLILLIAAGFTFVWQNAMANTLLQYSIADEIRGRVMGIYSLSFQVMMRLGGLQAGFMADSFGAPLTVGIGASLSILYSVYIWLRIPRIRSL